MSDAQTRKRCRQRLLHTIYCAPKTVVTCEIKHLQNTELQSRSRRLGLETVSRRIFFQTSRSRLGLGKVWEGLGLGLVSD